MNRSMVTVWYMNILYGLFIIFICSTTEVCAMLRMPRFVKTPVMQAAHALASQHAVFGSRNVNMLSRHFSGDPLAAQQLAGASREILTKKEIRVIDEELTQESREKVARQEIQTIEKKAWSLIDSNANLSMHDYSLFANLPNQHSRDWLYLIFLSQCKTKYVTQLDKELRARVENFDPKFYYEQAFWRLLRERADNKEYRDVSFCVTNGPEPITRDLVLRVQCHKNLQQLITLAKQREVLRDNVPQLLTYETHKNNLYRCNEIKTALARADDENDNLVILNKVKKAELWDDFKQVVQKMECAHDQARKVGILNGGEDYIEKEQEKTDKASPRKYILNLIQEQTGFFYHYGLWVLQMMSEAEKHELGIQRYIDQRQQALAQKKEFLQAELH